jgi:hypothetical protein
MTTASLTAALRACAAGLYPLEAGAELVIAHGVFLHRADFAGRFIEHGTSCGTAMAAIDWAAVIDALNDGQLPCSGAERRLLRLAASLSDGIPVDLQDAVTGLDQANLARVIRAISHASGQRSAPTEPEAS